MLTDEQKREYESILQLATQDMDHIDEELSAEIGRAKKRIEELQEQKRAVKLIFDGASARLGLVSVIELKEVDAGDLVTGT